MKGNYFRNGVYKILMIKAKLKGWMTVQKGETKRNQSILSD